MDTKRYHYDLDYCPCDLLHVRYTIDPYIISRQGVFARATA